MKIEFHIQMDLADYEILGSDDVLEALWTHQEALDWLDLQEFEGLLYKEIFDDEIHGKQVNLRLIYSLKPQEMTLFLLKFSRVLSTPRSYEQVRIYD